LILNLLSGLVVLAPISLTISSFMNVKLNYRKTCILSLYAMTMPLLLQTLLDISGIFISEFYILFYLISLIYCGLAIRELKNTDKSNLNIMN
jgi:asparagine N-glycosylation enzyme membrane subunit Stt3